MTWNDKHETLTNSVLRLKSSSAVRRPGPLMAHSQKTSTRQPPSMRAATAWLSRCRLASIFAFQNSSGSPACETRGSCGRAKSNRGQKGRPGEEGTPDRGAPEGPVAADGNADPCRAYRGARPARGGYSCLAP